MKCAPNMPLTVKSSIRRHPAASEEAGLVLLELPAVIMEVRSSNKQYEK